MASSEETNTVRLKLLVDEKRNKVVAAEANKDFVDILLSFLTMPLGTIVKATRNQPVAETTDTRIMGCMYNLYESVEKLNNENFVTDTCKTMLLNPRNPLAKYCLNLKVNVEDYCPGIIFMCSKRNQRCYSFCEYSQVKCRCGGIFDKQSFCKPPHSADDYQGAFIKGKMTFIISDDLKVTTNSPSSLVQFLSNLGLSDTNQIAEMSVDAGLDEISRLLKCSLISKSPMTDVFLPKKRKINNSALPEPGYIPPSLSEVQRASTCKLSLKIVIRKSTNRVLFAEANNDFVDFLFSLLTFPLGSMVKLLDGNSGLGCVDNLFRNVQCLDPEWLSLSPDNLLSAEIKDYYKCLIQPLRIRYRDASSSDFVDPRYLPGQPHLSGRFVKTPSIFIALDNLTVIPLSSGSSIGFLKELNVPFSDIEERVVTVGEAEALYILKASLTSSAALTNSLTSFFNIICSFNK